MKKKLAYKKVFEATENQDILAASIRKLFEDFGSIDEITISPEQKEDRYQVTVIITIEENFGEFEQFAYHQGWEKTREFLLPKEDS